MNPYLMLGSGLGTNEATSLSARLSAWHDAMVAHERRLRTGRTTDVCDDECPHAEAPGLWSEALAIFGFRAHELTFLRSRATDSARRSKAGAAAREPLSEAADTSLPSTRLRQTRGHKEGGSGRWSSAGQGEEKKKWKDRRSWQSGSRS
jgi:hypothetical protein